MSSGMVGWPARFVGEKKRSRGKLHEKEKTKNNGKGQESDGIKGREKRENGKVMGSSA